MWTTLEGYRLWPPRSGLGAITAQLRQPGLWGLVRRNFRGHLGSAVTRAIGQLASNASRAGTLRQKASGERRVVFTKRGAAGDYQLLARPITPRDLVLVTVRLACGTAPGAEAMDDPVARYQATRYGTTVRTGRSEQARHRDPLVGTEGHHGFPQYLGGAYRQQLLQLRNDLHYLYHQELDQIVVAPRRAGRRYYRQMSGTQALGMLKRLVRHAGEFDRRYRTGILPALRTGIRQARPLVGRRWP
jgi:hypothetical protein